MTMLVRDFSPHDAATTAALSHEPGMAQVSLADILAIDRTAAAIQQSLHSVEVSAGIVVFVSGIPTVPNRSYVVSTDGCAPGWAIYTAIADRLMAHKHAGAETIRRHFEFIMAQQGWSGDAAADRTTFAMTTAEAAGLVVLLETNAPRPHWRADVERHLHTVAPLLIELVRAERTKQCAAQRLGLLEGALDEMSIALFMLDAQVRPFSLNAAALARLAMGDAFQLTRTGILSCHLARDTLALHDCVKRIIGAPPGDMHETSLVISTGDGERNIATLRSVGTEGSGPDNRAALLTIQHETRLSPAVLDVLGLTASEQRFLSTFLCCSSLAATAKRLNLSAQSGRTYLKRICAKLGVRKQAELVSLVWNLSLPLRQKPDNSHCAAPGALGRLSYCPSSAS